MKLKPSNCLNSAQPLEILVPHLKLALMLLLVPSVDSPIHVKDLLPAQLSTHLQVERTTGVIRTSLITIPPIPIFNQLLQGQWPPLTRRRVADLPLAMEASFRRWLLVRTMATMRVLESLGPCLDLATQDRTTLAVLTVVLDPLLRGTLS